MPQTAGHDFNDTHKAGGIHAVQAELRDAKSVSTTTNNNLPLPINFSKISSESIDAIVAQQNAITVSEATMNINNTIISTNITCINIITIHIISHINNITTDINKTTSKTPMTTVTRYVLPLSQGNIAP